MFQSKWAVYLTKGNGYLSQSFFIEDLSTETHVLSFINIPKNRPKLIDMNGDGKADIVQAVYHLPSNTTTFTVLLSKGWVNDEYKYTKKTVSVEGNYGHLKRWYVGDFFGDGKYGLLVKDSASTQAKIIYVYQNPNYEFVKEITDGMEKTIELKYQHNYLTANSLHYTNPSTPVTSQKKYFLSLIDSLKITSGLGNVFLSLKYQYNQPSFSLLRKSFLGFKEFTCIDNNENKKDIRNFEFYDLNINFTNKQILKPVKQTIYINNQKITENFFTYILKDLPGNRSASYYSTITEKHFLSDTKTETTTDLNTDGRIKTSTTQIYNTCNTSVWLHSQTNTYIYDSITINGNQKKTVPEKILTTQQYGTSGFEIADTVTYEYNNAGNLTLMRKGNTDGSITTTYENYTAAGLFGKKTVAAQGCTPRIETYQYDATQRFVTKIINPIGHYATFNYNLSTGNKLSETDANLLTTTYTYDNFGNLKQITYPDGTQTKDTIYWFTGNNLPNARYCTTTTSTGKPALTVYYDLLGRELCRLNDGKYYDTRYNAKGQVTKTSYPYKGFPKPDTDKIWSEYTYDDFGRTHTVTAPYSQLAYSYNKRKVTVTDNLRNVFSWKNSDAMGRIDTAYDAGGTITYNYAVINSNNKKRHQTTITTNGATTKILSDLWGNRLSITEPNAGEVASTYNGFNELITQTDARGNITSYEYDELGRIAQKQITAPMDTPVTYFYFYDEFAPDNKGKGKLYRIRKNGAEAENFDYDSLGRLYISRKSDCGGFKYTYNKNGQLHKLIYPDGLEITYNYTSAGKLDAIRRSSDTSLIYRAKERNIFNATTLCEYGNGLATVYTYNPLGLLTRIHTGNKLLIEDTNGYDEPEPGGDDIDRGAFNYADSTILNYRYAYNTKGLMVSRSENIINLMEEFEYDNLDRLTEITSGKMGQAGTTEIFNYTLGGNIDSHSVLGDYTYGNKPHAVTKVGESPRNKAFLVSENTITYNFFNQPAVIEEGECRLELFYGVDQLRTKAIRYKNDTIQKVHFYYNKYAEHEIDYTTDTVRVIRFYRYIYGEDGVVALNIVTRTGTDSLDVILDSVINRGDFLTDEDFSSLRGVVTTDSMYYIHTDHLGSYCAITDAGKQVRQRNWFDPWGNYPVKYDTVYAKGIPPPAYHLIENYVLSFPLTYRGFTGHEHYPQFKIINMNCRLYDPVIGRFFSPDKYVANSTFTQDFNRYTYARNNPLMYTDPSGDFIITFLVNSIIGWSRGDGFGGGLKNGGNAVWNGMKIIGGLFTSDKNRTGGGQFWEVTSRLTWQSPQTAVGLVYSLFANMCGQIDNVSYKAGATVMSGNFWGTGEAITLGSYIHGTSRLQASFDNSLFQHEYGHYLQSQASGPLYLQRYGIPSAFSGGAFKNEDGIRYHKFHPSEQDANARALKYFSAKVPGFNSVDENGQYTGQWQFGSNPIIGYNQSLSFNDPMNQKALQYARLKPAWHDWVLGPNIFISGPLINTFVLNSQKRYHNKLDLMRADGFDIDDWLYYFKW